MVGGREGPYFEGRGNEGRLREGTEGEGRRQGTPRVG